MAMEKPTSVRRVPAEWERHAATWMQWPGSYESHMRGAFARIIAVVQQYEPVHILTSSEMEKQAAQRVLADEGIAETQITWHIIPVDNAWMRDNGPVYVLDGNETLILNWGFTGWDGTTGAYYQQDNLVPGHLADLLGLRIEDHSDYVLEKGNLEVNGAGTAVLNWDCQTDRNPGLSQVEHEALLKSALGLNRIIWAYGYDPHDITTGHIDGTARFIDENSLVVADYYGDKTERDLARDAKDAGLEVIRYPGDPNWLVGNGFVLAKSSGKFPEDKNLKEILESVFPGRDVHLIDVSSIADSGGGIHCVTNDQPQSK